MRAESPNSSHSHSMSVDLMSNTQKKFHMSQIVLNKIYDLNMLLPPLCFENGTSRNTYAVVLSLHSLCKY